MTRIYVLSYLCNCVLPGGIATELVFDGEGVTFMGIETAFLVGVLVGQWITFFAMWRFVTRLMKQLTLKNSGSHPEHSSGGEMIDISPDNFWDNDLL
jgi:hypothetical protein